MVIDKQQTGSDVYVECQIQMWDGNARDVGVARIFAVEGGRGVHSVVPFLN